MPYIKQEDRDKLEGTFDDREWFANSAGDLNYQFTQLINKYIETEGLRYQQINDIVGALEGAKAEFYRRVVVPYEDKKIEENGDVYTCGVKKIDKKVQLFNGSVTTDKLTALVEQGYDRNIVVYDSKAQPQKVTDELRRLMIEIDDKVTHYIVLRPSMVEYYKDTLVGAFPLYKERLILAFSKDLKHVLLGAY